MEEWLQFFGDVHTDLSEELMPVEMLARKEHEQQTVTLFRGFLEVSGGTVDNRQHNFGFDYTTSQNMSLCAEFLGVPCSRLPRQFGRFDPEEMLNALIKSKLFEGLQKRDLPDTLNWSHRIMELVPVGFPNNYLVWYSQSWGWRTLTKISESSIVITVRIRC